MAKRKARKADKIKISACYMVKSAADDLRRSLESVAPFVDEIIVVDTGSTDSTNLGKMISLRPETSRSVRLKVIGFSFSTPTNFL